MKLLFFAGSARTDSFNKRLAELACRIAEANGVDAVFANLRDYEMPLYDGDIEKEQGPPDGARRFKALMGEHQGIFIASPEYNSGVTPLLKNTIDWVSRVRDEGETPLQVFKTRVFAISGASPGYFGAMRSVLMLRQVLAVGCGALVIPEQAFVPSASNAFGEDGHLADKTRQKQLTGVVEALVSAARKFCG